MNKILIYELLIKVFHKKITYILFVSTLFFMIKLLINFFYINVQKNYSERVILEKQVKRNKKYRGINNLTP